jgi:cold shock CspA family protein
MSSADNSTEEAPRLIGQVKWFNNKAGYGFITVSDGEYAGKDIFAHYSTILVTNSQYKYLVQGEYVEFNLIKSTNDSHEFQATEISGIKKGSLMCESRRQTVQDENVERSTRPNYQRRYYLSSNDADRMESARHPRRRYSNDESAAQRDDSEFIPVVNKRLRTQRTRPTRPPTRSNSTGKMATEAYPAL